MGLRWLWAGEGIWKHGMCPVRVARRVVGGVQVGKNYGQPPHAFLYTGEINIQQI